jgi:hypothetical protein
MQAACFLIAGNDMRRLIQMDFGDLREPVLMGNLGVVENNFFQFSTKFL